MKSESIFLPDDVVLSVRDVSKKFCRNLRRSMWYGIQDLARDLLGRRSNGNRVEVDPTADGHSSSLPQLERDEFWALENVSFDLCRGETIGLIGLNGSGKTTLLRIINGIYPPNRGEVVIRGQVGGLIALGAGFHPHMTGRENIRLNGTILGMTRREIDAQMEAIIDFADIGDFIDSPVSTYSSGMSIRLGFAVAVAREPDLLLLDEILAVGDAAFRFKCYNKIGQMQKKSAVVFVSHSMDLVAQASTKGLLLSHGRIVHFGDVSTAINLYMAEGMSRERDTESFLKVAEPVRTASVSTDRTMIEHGGSVTVTFDVCSKTPVPNCSIRVLFYDPKGLMVAEWNSKRAGVRIDVTADRWVYPIALHPLKLKADEYKLGIALHDHTGVYDLLWSFKQLKLRVIGNADGVAPYQL